MRVFLDRVADIEGLPFFDTRKMILQPKSDALERGLNGVIDQFQLDVPVTPPHQFTVSRIIHVAGEEHGILVIGTKGAKRESPSTRLGPILESEISASMVICGDIILFST